MSTSTLYQLGKLGNASSSARQKLAKNFDTMGDLAGWVLYGRHHSGMSGITDDAAKSIRNSRPAFIRYFGGEEYIPKPDTQEMALNNLPASDGSQQTLGANTDPNTATTQ